MMMNADVLLEQQARESPAAADHRPRWLWSLFLLTPAVIWGCWRSPFIRFDDIFHIVENRALDLNLPWYSVFAPPADESYYYPFTLLTLRLDRWLWESVAAGWSGVEPWATGIRTGNLLLHFGAALIVYSILRCLAAGRLIAIFCTLAFALHPTTVETTAWCVERKNALAAFLGLAAWRIYLTATGGRQRALAALFYLMAVFSKLSALGLLPVVAAWELAFGQGKEIFTAPSPRAKAAAALALFSRLLPWLTASGAAIAAALAIGSHLMLPPPGGSLYTAALTDGVILGRYAWNFFWPQGLSTHYAIVAVHSPLDATWLRWSALFCLLVLATCVLTPAAHRRLCIFAWLWFIAGLGPNLNFVGINDLMHDRFAYLSSPAFWLALALACQGLPRHLGDKDLGRRYAPILLVLLSLWWAKESAGRSRLYQDTAFLFIDTVAKEPGSAAAHYFLFTAYNHAGIEKQISGDLQQAGLFSDQAMRELERCVASVDFERFYQQAFVHALLARFYFDRGLLTKAEAQLAAAQRGRLSHHPQVLWQICFVRGQMAARKEEFPLAIMFFRQALGFSPKSAEIRPMLASAILSYGRNREQQGEGGAFIRACDEAEAILLSVPSDHPSYKQARWMLAQIQRARESTDHGPGCF